MTIIDFVKCEIRKSIKLQEEKLKSSKEASKKEIMEDENWDYHKDQVDYLLEISLKSRIGAEKELLTTIKFMELETGYNLDSVIKQIKYTIELDRKELQFRKDLMEEEEEWDFYEKEENHHATIRLKSRISTLQEILTKIEEKIKGEKK